MRGNVVGRRGCLEAVLGDVDVERNLALCKKRRQIAVRAVTAQGARPADGEENDLAAELRQRVARGPKSRNAEVPPRPLRRRGAVRCARGEDGVEHGVDGGSVVEEPLARREGPERVAERVGHLADGDAVARPAVKVQRLAICHDAEARFLHRRRPPPRRRLRLAGRALARAVRIRVVVDAPPRGIYGGLEPGGVTDVEDEDDDWVLDGADAVVFAHHKIHRSPPQLGPLRGVVSAARSVEAAFVPLR
mmetsp:Transcript_22515/g.78100  ORF Transcript_22515/g.78100 Transcript_22515/m.78100 type:complete len:248 (-) Transcript_22515:650-1393(-)